MSIGTTALLDAIKEFDLARAEKYRLATYAGHHVRQQITKFIKESQLIPQTAFKKVCDFCQRLKSKELKKVLGDQKYICNSCSAENTTLKTEEKKVPT